MDAVSVELCNFATKQDSVCERLNQDSGGSKLSILLTLNATKGLLKSSEGPSEGLVDFLVENGKILPITTVVAVEARIDEDHV